MVIPCDMMTDDKVHFHGIRCAVLRLGVLGGGGYRAFLGAPGEIHLNSVASRAEVLQGFPFPKSQGNR